MIKFEEVKHIAELARIEFSDKELKGLQNELSSILGYIDKLKEIDIEGVRPTSHSVDLENVMRDDKGGGKNIKAADRLLKTAPQTKGRLVKVKSVF